jgi:hypothetical protein
LGKINTAEFIRTNANKTKLTAYFLQRPEHQCSSNSRRKHEKAQPHEKHVAITGLPDDFIHDTSLFRPKAHESQTGSSSRLSGQGSQIQDLILFQSQKAPRPGGFHRAES